MTRIAHWFGARPHRATVTNLLLLSAILAIANSPELYTLVGGIALVMAAAGFAFRAIRWTRASWRQLNVYQVALTWIPGLLPIALAAGGLVLISAARGLDLAYGLGAVLFAAQIAMLAVATADLGAVQHPRTGEAD